MVLPNSSEGVFVSVVIPAYNEEERIESCCNKVAKTLDSYGRSFEIILEEDGSTDRTPEIIARLAEQRQNVKALRHVGQRMGKGFGVRRCLHACSGDVIVLIDSDLEYPPEMIPSLLERIRDFDVVVGRRRGSENDAVVKMRGVRDLASRVFCLLIRRLFDVGGFEDIQAGFKAFRRDVIDHVQPLTSDGFEIDCEILLKAVRRGFRVGYLPVSYNYNGDSKVNMLSDPLKMLLCVLKWKVNGNLGAKENIPCDQRAPFLMRKKIEAEAGGYDQGKVGYESRNPFVRLFFRKKIEAVLEFISGSHPDPVYVLDVGCGDGLLLEKLPGTYKVGFDLSVTRLKRAKLRAPNSFFVCGDAQHLPFKRSSFDVISCLDTMEHLSNPNDCADCLETSVVNGGLVVIALPDDRFLSLARFLVFKYPFCLKGHGHVSSFTLETFVHTFRTCKLFAYRNIPSRVFSIVSLFGLKKVIQPKQRNGEVHN